MSGPEGLTLAALLHIHKLRPEKMLPFIQSGMRGVPFETKLKSTKR